ncbi:MAG: DNA polymerase III subunit delta [Salinivirgaceae bacterium]|nr:DNA polymerase III subunit delta [Salinivirgaceae bacterium]MBR4619400.1 DNA polymerase III subunit delta [Salinivirgaceae bacterium]
MRFADIIGQDDVKRHLIGTVKENRISHAQMFLGREGFGSLPLAIAYAQYINCQHRTDSDSCGECPSCRQISQLAFPDLHFVFPVPTAGSEDKSVSDNFFEKWSEFIMQNPYGNYQQWLDFVGAGNSQGLIRVKESSEIIRKLSMKSFSAEYKIMIIWLAEKMNAETANKLLKLIEEPYPKTLFLLVAENAENILPTIISRTQLVRVPRIADSDIQAGLQQRAGISANAAEKIAGISEGDFGRALDYCGHAADLAQNLELFIKLMRTSYSFKAPEMIALAEELGALGREKQKAFLAYCERMVRENLIVNQHLDKMAHLTDDESGFASKFSRFIHPQNSMLIAETLDKAIYHISRNAGAKIVFMDTIITLARCLRMPNE